MWVIMKDYIPLRRPVALPSLLLSALDAACFQENLRAMDAAGIGCSSKEVLEVGSHGFFLNRMLKELNVVNMALVDPTGIKRSGNRTSLIWQRYVLLESDALVARTSICWQRS